MNARDDNVQRGDGFLGRWIRRKAEAREQPESPDASPDDRVDDLPADVAKGQAATGTAADEPAFDLSKLPSLEEINAQTNLTDFMRREVPAVLRNAALRRAWALDPAIRDYVNPAREYAYDWNVPGGVPGNGPIEAGYDALKQVAETLWSPPSDNTLGVREATDEASLNAESGADTTPQATESVRTSDIKNVAEQTDKSDKNEISELASEAPADPNPASVPQRRRHGGAAPA
jgi:hypothetical protein